MTIQNKIIIGLSSVIFVGLLVFGIIILKNKIDALTTQNELLSEQLNKSNTEINAIKAKVNKNIETLNNYNAKQLDIEIKYNKIEQKINKHDYENIAKKKPKVLAKILTNAYNKNIKEVEKITTSDEINIFILKFKSSDEWFNVEIRRELPLNKVEFARLPMKIKRT